MKEKYQEFLQKEHSFDSITMVGIFCFLIVVSGVFGFVYEFIFYYFNSGMKEFFWRGGNFLPWINIYAYGAIAVYLFTYRYRKSPWKVFWLSLVTCAVIELIGGLGLYVFGNGFRCWNYNQEILNFGNIGGFVCLRSVLVFALFSLLLIYFVVPITFYIASKLPRKVFLTLTISLCFIVFLDEIYNLVIARMFGLKRASDIYKKIGFHYVSFHG